jgi:hypothetical protein
MKLRAIDIVLNAIEDRADQKAFDLDTYEPYVEICRICADLEVFRIEPTTEQKQFCAETLETLCNGLGLNYHALLTHALLTVTS